MTYPETIFAFLHHGRQKENKPLAKIPRTANVVLTVCFVMLIMSVFFTLILISPSLGNGIEDFLEDVFGRTSGRAIGKILAILIMALVYPVIKYTIGTQENFNRLKNIYLGLLPEEQALAAKKGARFFYLCLASLAVPFVLSVVG